jgi:ABC-type Mn2+/Zn2+ transport system ATPase subunit
MPAAAIAVEHLNVGRRGPLALDDVSLTLDSGSVTGLLGPSGAGRLSRAAHRLGYVTQSGRRRTP